MVSAHEVENGSTCSVAQFLVSVMCLDCVAFILFDKKRLLPWRGEKIELIGVSGRHVKNFSSRAKCLTRTRSPIAKGAMVLGRDGRSRTVFMVRARGGDFRSVGFDECLMGQTHLRYSRHGIQRLTDAVFLV
jgi:hypothetical protein